MIPVGVHGNGAGLPSTSQPRLVGCSPSTSFTGSTAARIANSSNPVGCCTRNAVHAGSAFSSATTPSTSAWLAPAGRSRRMLLIPISAQSLCLALTYQRLAGSSPTSTVPSPGRTPRSTRAATRSASSDLMAARVAFPSRVVALMMPPSCQARMSGPRPSGSVDDDAEHPCELDGLVPIDPCLGQVRCAWVEPSDERAGQLRAHETRPLQPHLAQVGAGQRRIPEVGAGQVGAV